MDIETGSSSSSSSSNSYGGDIEGVLENIRINASLLYDYNRKEFIRLNKQIKKYRIPVLICSSLASVWALMGGSIVGEENSKLINSLLAFIAGTTTSIELFEKIDERMKLNEENAHHFYTISIDIYKTLSLREQHRSIDGLEYLTDVFNKYAKLVENSNLTSHKIKDKLMPLPVDFRLPLSDSNMTLKIPSTPEASV